MNVLGRNCLWVFWYNFCTVARVKMSVIKNKERKKKYQKGKKKKKKPQNTLKTHSLKDRFRIIVSHSFVHYTRTNVLRDCEVLVLKMTKYFVKLTGTKFLVMRSKADQFPTERKYLATHFPTCMMR